jgi:hypothetical protein
VPTSELESGVIDNLMHTETSVASMDTSSISPEGLHSCNIIIDNSGTFILSRLGNVESLILEFDRRLTELTMRTKEELSRLQKSVDTVYILLKTVTRRDFHNFVLKLRGRPPESFDELFNDLNSYRWNIFEYDLLETIIKRNNCSPALRRDMEQYAENVNRFRRYTPTSNMCKLRRGFLKRKSPLKGYKKLTTKFNIDPHKSMLTALDPLPEKVHGDLNFSLHLTYGMKIGSIVVEWRFYEEHEYNLMTYLCSEDGRGFLEHCEITEVLIDDIPVDHSVR